MYFNKKVMYLSFHYNLKICITLMILKKFTKNGIIN